MICKLVHAVFVSSVQTRYNDQASEREEDDDLFRIINAAIVACARAYIYTIGFSYMYVQSASKLPHLVSARGGEIERGVTASSFSYQRPPLSTLFHSLIYNLYIYINFYDRNSLDHFILYICPRLLNYSNI